MTEQESLVVAGVARELRGSLMSIQTLMAKARGLVNGDTPEGDRLDFLLQVAEVKALAMAEDLRHVVVSLPTRPPDDRDQDATVIHLTERPPSSAR